MNDNFNPPAYLEQGALALDALEEQDIHQNSIGNIVCTLHPINANGDVKLETQALDVIRSQT